MQILLTYFIIGAIFAFVTEIRGGNIGTEYVLKKFSYIELKIIVIALWIPIVVFFLFFNGRVRW